MIVALTLLAMGSQSARAWGASEPSGVPAAKDKERPASASPNAEPSLATLSSRVDQANAAWQRGDYPDGLFVSLNGRVSGLREGQVGEHRYVFPLVEPGHVHRWPPGFQFDRPQWHIGIGVGVRIR